MVESAPDSISDEFLKQLISRRKLDPWELKATLEDLPDEGLLANIEQVADRIRRAMFTNEPLIIFGHDDPDGITSTYILYQFFNSCGYQRHRYYIPNRNLEPHGIQKSFVDHVREGGYSLVVTVDNGIASYDGVAGLNQLGCDVIITDHHLIQPEQLPPAQAILNPQLPQCQYPYKSLAGVGVVLMLIRYLGRILDHPVPLSAYFWNAVGSIADKVPMTGVNRILVRHVLDNIHSLNDPSVEFLLRNYSRVSNRTDAFNFIQNTSRLIANGREPGGQHTAMRFLLQMGDEKASLFENLERQKNVWESELNRVFSFLDTVSTGFSGNAFVYFDDEDVIPYNLLGTASTYMVHRLGIPAIMLKIHNGKMVCEGRCTDGFNMVEAFTHCRQHLVQYGGHAKAAGFSMEPHDYDGFLECYSDYLASRNIKPSPEDHTDADACLQLADFNHRNWMDLEQLLPFGQQNSEPVILVRNTSLSQLQNLFTIDYNSTSIPMGKTGDVYLQWKNPQGVRILAFQEKKAGKN
jgi:single-stranded-DNA-specific exonuclease